ncbi:hypothetical protein MHYP_G00347700 [Metynnis hypsauchen]
MRRNDSTDTSTQFIPKRSITLSTPAEKPAQTKRNDIFVRTCSASSRWLIASANRRAELCSVHAPDWLKRACCARPPAQHVRLRPVRAAPTSRSPRSEWRGARLVRSDSRGLKTSERAERRLGVRRQPMCFRGGARRQRFGSGTGGEPCAYSSPAPAGSAGDRAGGGSASSFQPNAGRAGAAQVGAEPPAPARLPRSLPHRAARLWTRGNPFLSESDVGMCAC